MWKCEECGREFRRHDKPVIHNCSKKSRGLGDSIAKITKSVGIKPCGRCEKRRQRLNQLVPYKDPSDS